MKIFLISNMYPSKTDPLFGVFVKNFKEGLETIGVNFSQEALIKGKSTSSIKKGIKYILHYFKILFGFIKSNYDLIYVHYLTHHLPILFILLPFKRKKWVINVHGSDIIGITPNGKIDALATKLLSAVDLLVVPTSYFRDLIITKYPFLTADKFYISPSGGIDANIFYVKKNKQPNTILTLGFISRFIEEKGWKTFLEALLLLKQNNIPFKAIIAGKGPDQDKILEYIKEYNLSNEIEFLGLVKQNQLVDIYNSLDLYIFPSYREAESLGLTGLEAMSCGTPVIACNTAGPSTYVTHKVNGYLFEPKNSIELSQYITKYYDLSIKERSIIIKNAIKTSFFYKSQTVNERLYIKLKEFIKTSLKTF
ncbi:MAG: glycosyltransferase family 4 protein [Galbibacter orientalis]|uniref:glycosyltransferase family 4 protein n=1 Tax=Galbibacter orientalis TaxID=453852 RepID=UPI003002E0BD